VVIPPKSGIQTKQAKVVMMTDNIEAQLTQLESQDSSEDMTVTSSPGGPGLRGDISPLTPEKATSPEGPRGDVSPPLTPQSPPDTNYSKVTAAIAQQEEVWVEEEISEKCQHCDEFFPNVESVKNHNLEKHGGEHCKLCKKVIVGNFEDHLYNDHYNKKIQDAVPLTSRGCSGSYVTFSWFLSCGWRWQASRNHFQKKTKHFISVDARR
jgi:hypothetical protein